MEFPEKLRYVREKLNISQEDLARALNVSYATINRWENSKTKPIKMAQAAFYDYCKKHGVSFEGSEES
ncbi:MAG: helix-turn-helix transcriptional regulator [Clostridiaceae bacterium]|nr:helix-turn-helix domain-containing protein [Eubacteriales bacterium]